MKEMRDINRVNVPLLDKRLDNFLCHQIEGDISI